MTAVKCFAPADPVEQKLQIERRLGSMKACEYFHLLSRYLSLKISKCKFNKLCVAIIGRDNVRLHNQLMTSILKRACLSESRSSGKGKVEGSLSVRIPNRNQKSDLQSLCRGLLQSPRKTRTPNLRDRRFKDRPSPRGPLEKQHTIGCEYSAHKFHEQRSIADLYSVGSMPPLSVDDEEEINQYSGSPVDYDRGPITAPLGIPTYKKRPQKVFFDVAACSSVTSTCQNSGQLPDTNSLLKRLEQKLEMEGVKMSVDSANLLNSAVDVYLKRLIKPCLELVVSKSVDKISGQIQPDLNVWSNNRYVQKPSETVPASISDFRTTLELNPVILGEGWPLHFEKICLWEYEE